MRIEACYVVPKTLVKRVEKLKKLGFINKQGLLRLINGGSTPHVKLVPSNHWPRKGTLSDKFCCKLQDRLVQIEHHAKYLNLVARGK